MSDQNTEGLDIDSMSIDELDKLLNEKEGSLENDKEELVEESKETAETTSIDESDGEESKDKPEKSDNEVDIEPQYKGKSVEDLLEMQRNATRKISKQSNELYHYKKKLEEYEKARQEIESVKDKTIEDDTLSRYESEDLTAVKLLVKNELKERDLQEIEIKKKIEASAIEDNEISWENLKTFNPDLFEEIKEEMVSIMKNDIDSTYKRKGWVKDFISSKKTSSSKDKKPHYSVKKRVASISSGGSSASTHIKKSVDEMSLDEYEQYVSSKGIKF